MRERGACGIGFVADARGRASRELVDLALEALCRVRHRGAVAADRRTGDGAGLLLSLPRALVPSPWCGLAMVFVRDEAARERIELACAAEGIEHFGWRSVPIVPEALGEAAQASMPQIEQLVLRPKELYDNAVPSGNSVAADVLQRVALLSGDPDRERIGVSAIRLLRDVLGRAPTAFGHALCALDLYLGPSREVAIVGCRHAHEINATFKHLSD